MRARHAKHDSFFAAPSRTNHLDVGGGSRDHSAETHPTERFAHLCIPTLRGRAATGYVLPDCVEPPNEIDERDALMIGRVVLFALLMTFSAAAFAADSSGDPVSGKAIFQHMCQNCHSTEIGINKVGPSLCVPKT